MKFYTGIGSRQTPKDICDLMTRTAAELEGAGYILRSGGAEGADTAFEKGVKLRKEIYIPWKNFNGNPSLLFEPSQEAIEMARQFHPAWDKCSKGAKILHARNCHQILGKDLKTNSLFALCWTPGGRLTGGTAQALRIAMHYGIPICNFGASDAKEQFRKLLPILE